MHGIRRTSPPSLHRRAILGRDSGYLAGLQRGGGAWVGGRTTRASVPSICVEDALRVGAADVIRAAREQHPELWAGWLRTGEAALLPVLAPLTRGAG